jgi:hypothetical protein
MLTLHANGPRLCDGLTRREWLRVGGLAAFGLSLPQLAAGRLSAATDSAATGSGFGRAKACIVLFHLGGPSQLETWDPKPDAPDEVRGDLRPINSPVAGIRVGELMPRTAKLTDKICILRAMSTDDNAHSSSGYWMLTGRAHQPGNFENALPGPPNDAPSVGALVQRLRPARGGLPGAVVLPEHIWNTGGLVWPGQDGGFLGRSADPWLLHCQPQDPEFQVPGLGLPEDMPGPRLGTRESLLVQVNRRLEALEQTPAFAQFDDRSRQAFNLLRAGQSRRAFELAREPAALRDRYGRNRWGQSVLLARRLVEAGVSLVQVNWTRMPTDDDVNGSPAWDTHSKNARRMRSPLMPIMDAAYSTLLEDLAARGLLEETLVVWMGEFGRSPKINAAAGRDHWGHVFSVALAGGGVRGGQVLGASDRIAGFPKEGRVRPNDLLATVLHCLGYSAHTEMRDTLGRPISLSSGEVIRGMV